MKSGKQYAIDEFGTELTGLNNTKKYATDFQNNRHTNE